MPRRVLPVSLVLMIGGACAAALGWVMVQIAAAGAIRIHAAAMPLIVGGLGAAVLGALMWLLSTLRQPAHKRLAAGQCPMCSASLLGALSRLCPQCGKEFTDEEVGAVWAGYSSRRFNECVVGYVKGTNRGAMLWACRCPACKYPLGGLGDATCPECGEAFDEEDVEFAWMGYRSRNPEADKPNREGVG